MHFVHNLLVYMHIHIFNHSHACLLSQLALLTPFQQLVLTLMQLRLNFSYRENAHDLEVIKVPSPRVVSCNRSYACEMETTDRVA